jgi:hypothetical protein
VAEFDSYFPVTAQGIIPPDGLGTAMQVMVSLQ